MKNPLPADFNKLWASQSISSFGSQISSVALPLTAVLVLEATPREMGWLGAFQYLPMAIFGLVAGVWADRMRRRPILIVSDFARAALLLSIPIAAYFNLLTLAQLCVVSFAAGSFKVVAAVADRAYLTSILSRDQLMAGNSKIWFSFSLAQTLGPGLAGWLVKALTAPIAIVVDAASFLVAGLALLTIGKEEQKPTHIDGESMGKGVRFGLSYVWNHALLKPLVLCAGMHNICSTMIVTVYFLYLSRQLEIDPGLLGGILVTGGVGSVCGSILARRLTNRLGSGSTLIALQVLTGVARLLIPLAAGSIGAVIATLALSEFLLGLARSMFNITQISLRQSIIPDDAQGRVNASIGFVLWGFTPIGALAAGFSAEAFGIRETLAAAALGVLLSTGWMLISPLRGYHMEASTTT